MSANTSPPSFSAARLAEIREEKGLSPERLGALCSVSGMTIRNWEAGKHLPDVEDLVNLAVALGVDKESFFVCREATP